MKLNVGVLRGGFSPEYDISLKSGGQVIAGLPRDKYRPVDILLDKDGTWHIDGVPTKPEELKSVVDVVFNNLHGGYGEDGLVQQFFDSLDIPYTGSSSLPSRITYNKALAKEKFKKMGLLTPVYEIVSLPNKIEEPVRDNFYEIVHDGAKKVFSKVMPPWVVKPLSSGFSIDTYIAKDFNALAAAIANVLYNHDHALVEQYIKGREMVTGVVDGFRSKDQYTLLPLEVIKSNDILDYQARQSGDYHLLPPMDLNMDKKIALEEIAAQIHENFDLRDYSLVDLILSRNGIYILEVDSMPGFSEHSIFPKALEHIGADLPQIFDCVIKNTMARQ